MTNILSYKDWIKSSSVNATLENPYESYLAYVKDWYGTRFANKSTDELTADEYKNFLLTLTNISEDPKVLAYIKHLDYTNVNEVQTAIPFLASNLAKIAKNISTYRVDSKASNIANSYSNSNKGIEMKIYKDLLTLHANNAGLHGTPLLDDIRHVSVEIEELYDDQEYLDKQPGVSPSAYYETSGTSEYLGEQKEYVDWILKSGYNELYSNNALYNPETSSSLPISGYLDYGISGTSVEYYKGNLSDTLMGEAHYRVSGDGNARELVEYSSASNPWNNLGSRYFPTIATIPLLDGTYAKHEVGGFFIPSKLGMPVALGRNKFNRLGDIVVSGNESCHFPEGSKYSNGYTFTKTYQDSCIEYNSYLNWIEIIQLRGPSKGIIGSNIIYQEMTPYQTSYETNRSSYLGINRIGDNSDPWYLSEDKVWRDNTNSPPDFRNIYNVQKWYDENAVGISGYQDQWAVDIYGNNYALYKESSSENWKLWDRNEYGFGQLYVRDINGIATKFSSYFGEDLFDWQYDNQLKWFNVYNDILIFENVWEDLFILKIAPSGDGYAVAPDSIYLSWDIEDHDNIYFRTAGHYFDDKTQTLYFGRYNADSEDLLHFIIYRYDGGNVVEIYNSDNDESAEMRDFKSKYRFLYLTANPSMVISPFNNTMYVTYISSNYGINYTYDRYIVIIPILLGGEASIGEITVVEPNPTDDHPHTARSWEWHELVSTMISDNNLIIFFNGYDTDGKYLQCIPLN